MSKKYLFLVFLLFCKSSIFSQDLLLFDWQLHTSFKNITASTVDDSGNLWCGTNGGIFVYNSSDRSFKTFNSMNGILSNNVSAIHFDPVSKLIFAGFSNGIIEIFTKDFKIQHITSISTSDFPNLKINKIISHNGFLYIATGFGIAVYDINKEIFTTSVVKIANWNRTENINTIHIANNKIWAASKSGIASCDLTKFIEIPNNWEIIEFPSTNKNIVGITSFQNQLLFCNPQEVFAIDNNSIQSIAQVNSEILELISNEYSCWIITQNGIIDKDGKYFYTNECNGGFINNSLMLANTTSGVVIIRNGNSSEPISPNSPSNNTFSSLAIDEDGVLWSTSAHLQALFYKGGLTKFENGVWENFSSKEFPIFITDNFYNVAIINGILYSSSVGGGVAYCNPYQRPLQFSFLSERNEKFVGTKTESDTFLFVGDFKSDSKGNVWFTNWGQQSAGPILLARTNDGKSYPFSNCYKSDERRILKLEIDNFGTKWIGSYPGEGIGIFYFNEKNTFENNSDDVCGMISTSTFSSLPDNSPTVIKKDPNGCLWLGFRQGLSVIFNPSAVLSKNQLIVRQINHLNNQYINDILMDPTGNAWIVTQNGIYIVSYNTFELVKIINTSNSPLKTNNIYSICGNFENGTIYFGSDNGLYSVKTNIIEPKDKYDILCYPQPFKLNKDEYLSIDGLASNTELKIITVNGEFVRSLQTTSRKTYWDGRDANNKKVSSGVYFVIGTSETTNSTGVQKIIVINE